MKNNKVINLSNEDIKILEFIKMASINMKENIAFLHYSTISSYAKISKASTKYHIRKLQAIGIILGKIYDLNIFFGIKETEYHNRFRKGYKILKEL